MFLLVGLIVDL